MLGRFGRRRKEAPSAERTREETEATASTADLLSLLQAIEETAGQVYGRHGLPQRPGHYRRPADSEAWEPLGDALTPSEKWALINESPDGGRWRYSAYEDLGAHSDIAIVRQASAILAACQGLRQRLTEHSFISAQDLADSIRLGEAWHSLVEEASHDNAPSPPLKFLPPQDAD
ncbi:hypothetical protein [Brevundimonas sp. CEF1]|uniref:hypothetical protein n=1 Tax=Brevundimonas sp. CEF1 TaxID=3442642 RepID=UPI003F5190C2